MTTARVAENLESEKVLQKAFEKALKAVDTLDLLKKESEEVNALREFVRLFRQHSPNINEYKDLSNLVLSLVEPITKPDSKIIEALLKDHNVSMTEAFKALQYDSLTRIECILIGIGNKNFIEKFSEECQKTNFSIKEEVKSKLTSLIAFHIGSGENVLDKRTSRISKQFKSTIFTLGERSFDLEHLSHETKLMIEVKRIMGSVYSEKVKWTYVDKDQKRWIVNGMSFKISEEDIQKSKNSIRKLNGYGIESEYKIIEGRGYIYIPCDQLLAEEKLMRKVKAVMGGKYSAHVEWKYDNREEKRWIVNGKGFQSSEKSMEVIERNIEKLKNGGIKAECKIINKVAYIYIPVNQRLLTEETEKPAEKVESAGYSNVRPF